MKEFWKESLVRFAVSLMLILIVLIGIFIGVGVYSKEIRADLSAASLRNSFLIGDNRSVLDILSNTLKSDFLSIHVRKLNDEKVWIIGGTESSYVKMRYEVKILSNPQMATSEVGMVIFYYDIFPFVKNAFFVWGLFIFLGIPFLVFEKNRLKKKYEIDLKLQEAYLAKSLAEKVSHDIRSPVAVVSTVVSNLNNVPEKDLAILKTALQRIDSISNELLRQGGSFESTVAGKETNLQEAIESIINEKMIEFTQRQDVKIVMNLVKGAIVPYCEESFKRIVSNLINNSYEAIEKSGLIEINLAIIENRIIFEVHDSGKGIPREIINNLGDKGFSYGKKTGSGLGLYHAKKDLERIDGKLSIESVQGRGTIVRIDLPLLRRESDNTAYVFIDDDEFLRIIWKEAARKKGINLCTFSSIKDFESNISKFNFDTQIYIDSELGKDSMKGEDFALLLHQKGYENLFISSGHPAERFVQYPWLKYVSKKCPI